MSAFSVGGEVSTKDSAGVVVTTPPPTSTAPAAFVKWIPGEAITFYAAILGLGAAQPELTGKESPQQILERIDAGSQGWFWLGAGIAAILVILGSLTGRPGGAADNTVLPGSIVARVVLTVVSFLIWATALPGAWPSGWHFIQDMGDAYPLLLVPVAAIFAGIAELVTKRYKW